MPVWTRFIGPLLLSGAAFSYLVSFAAESSAASEVDEAVWLESASVDATT
jgi:hypothetical protein